MKPQRLIDSLSDNILATIRSNGLTPGQALPPAQELAHRFGVTVPSVREALRRLEAIDVVELRHGSGTYVGSSINRRVLDNPYYAPEGSEAIREFYDARIALEPGIAALAAHQCDEEALLALSQIADEGPDRASDPLAGTFHIELARASRNRALQEHLEVLLALNIRAHPSSPMHDDLAWCRRDHKEIVDALRRSAPGEVGNRMRKHLTDLKTTALDAEEKDGHAAVDQ